MKKLLALLFVLISSNAFAAYTGPVVSVANGGTGATSFVYNTNPLNPWQSWGDSLTAGSLGSGGITAPFAKASGFNITNDGIGGQTSTQIGQRQGGIAFTITITSGNLSTGSNAVSSINGTAIQGCSTGCSVSPNVQPLSTSSDNTTRSMYGSVCTYHGVLTRTASGGPPSTSETYTFTPDFSSGGPFACSGAQAFTADSASLGGYPAVIWAGKNNIGSTATVIADNASMAAVYTTPNYLILGLTLSEGDYSGTSNYNNQATINTALSSAYGTKYLNPVVPLLAAYTPSSPADVIDYNNGIPPASLRGLDGTGTITSAITTTSTCSFSYNITTGAAVTTNFQIITVDSEQILVSTSSAGSVTGCTRAYNGSTAATHLNGATISKAVDPTHLSQTGYNLIGNYIWKTASFLNNGALANSSIGAVSNTIAPSIVPPQDTNLASFGIGSGALVSLAANSQYYNTVVGVNAMNVASSALNVQNTVVGYGAAQYASGSSYKNATIMGFNAAANATINNFVAIGVNSMNALNAIGGYDVVIGEGSMSQATSGYNDTFVGEGAGGTSGAVRIDEETGIGQQALSHVTGYYNTALGYLAGSKITSGASNTAIGEGVASSTLTTGSNNILIGVGTSGVAGGADTVSSGDNNKINIGGLWYGNTLTNAVPVVTTCGTNTVESHSNNAHGQINITAGTPAACTITFAGAYSTWVHCVVTAESTTATFQYTASTTAIGLTAAALAGKYDYTCQGY